VSPAIPAALGLAAVTALAILCRRLDPQRHRCPDCRSQNPLTPWKLRALAAARPGPGWAARVRYGLRRAEYEERVRLGMPMRHPDWITGELAEDREELLAALDAETWEEA